MFVRRTYPNCESFDPNHEVNWYVYRDKNIRGILVGLWGNGPDNPADMDSNELATLDQRASKSINILFRNMEKYGYQRDEFSNYRYDRNNDMYHCHIGKYIILWEVV